ncbi:hypothetical protein GLW08_02265 [Pontibacillus yanchengensis]|uniref:Uncharacterized protein n=2 Tax=Pontibacillus yanchengensis TaxID=462910 RepID=A0ACC7VBP7_9BACI|nr:pyridoxamine 5'-phosphate oxidase family protein [Pontibacillus yanchengensis]MYL32992.1 hypothetical protein [Pontibacillus yanchengensis]MYL52158.1 hypothetical protein [Pontibacillus yanchengensis]
MANQVEKKLNEVQYQTLQSERYVLLSTIDYETATPMVNAISWVYAPSAFCIRFAIDNRSKIVENIRNHPYIVITLITDDSTYAIKGKAVIEKDNIEGVPLKLAMIELTIEEVRDVMFYGAKIANAPEYEKTYDNRAAAKLDNQVMNALKI